MCFPYSKHPLPLRVNTTVKNTTSGVSIESETDISPLGSPPRSITNPNQEKPFTLARVD